MIRLLLLFISVNCAFCTTSENYYWREYKGEIPEDAILAGQNVNNTNIYIGQAYIYGIGIIVTEITSGKKEVEAPFFFSIKISSNIKILCGDPQNFYWENVSSSLLHAVISDKKPVVGGHEIAGVLYIGRINRGSNTKIGKVNAFTTGDGRIHYIDKGSEKTANSYQILIHKDSPNIDIRNSV